MNSLYPPSLPQMADNNFITQDELTGNGGVVIEIQKYANVARGDNIHVYWNGFPVANKILTEDPDSYSWPMIFTIPENLAPDGTYPTYYTVIDAAYNQSTSDTVFAIIDRDHSDGLPPPTFPDANTNNVITSESVIEQSGTHIHVPYTSGAFNINDTVTVYWAEWDSLGNYVNSSAFSARHTIVSEDMTGGFDVHVPSSFVSAVETKGRGEARYVVDYVNGSTEGSQTGTVNIELNDETIYPSPEFPDSQSGWLTCRDITEFGVELIVPANDNFVAGSTVSVFWTGYSLDGSPVTDTYYSVEYIISQGDATGGFEIQIPVEYVYPIGIGYAVSWYQVSTPSPIGSSSSTIIFIDTIDCNLLPPPVFPAATSDNNISPDEVSEFGGVEMEISYLGMIEGDTVSAYWTGYKDNSAESVSWEADNHIISKDEQDAQKSTFLIPAEYVDLLFDGYATGEYMVIYKHGGAANSGDAEVTLKDKASNGLELNCSTGAPLFDPSLTVRPVNTVYVKGEAGVEIELAIQSGADAHFIDSKDTSYTLSLDENGEAKADIYSLLTGAVGVTATQVDNPVITGFASMTFTDWIIGKGDLIYYGVTTRAEAGNNNLCYVWFQISPTATSRQVRCAIASDNDALVASTDGKDGLINAEGVSAGGFSIKDNTAETADFTLSIVDDSIESYVQGQLIFI